jgi:hypothetical protein
LAPDRGIRLLGAAYNVLVVPVDNVMPINNAVRMFTVGIRRLFDQRILMLDRQLMHALENIYGSYHEQV